MGWLAELGRRNVLRVAMAYLVTAWLLLQVSDVVTTTLGLPGWLPRVVFVLLALGLPVTLLLAWMFEWTPQGPVRDRRRRRSATANAAGAEPARLLRIHRLDMAIIGGLLALLAWSSLDRLRSTEAPQSAAPPAPALRSIAVLPFAAFSADAADGYLADGLTEEILNRLVGTAGLRVVGRTSSFAYRNRTEDLRGIASALGVDLLLEGSVRRAGDDLRITAQLVDGRDGLHLWSRTYNQRLADIFAVQDTVAVDVARELSLSLAPAPTAVATRDPQAMALYLQAKAAREENIPERVGLALGWIVEATRRDPQFAEAHALRALIELDQARAGVVADDRALPRARAAIDRALSLAPESPVILSAASRVLVWEADAGAGFALIAQARSLLERAVSLRPDDVDILQRYAWILMQHGELRAAGSILDQAIELDGLSRLHRGVLIGHLLPLGRWLDARRMIEGLPEDSPERHYLTAFAADPGTPVEQIHAELIECIRLGQSACYALLSMMYFTLGDDENAIAALESVPEAHAAHREIMRIWALQMRGNWQPARAFVQQRFPELIDAPYYWLDNLADQATAAGDWPDALRLWRRVEPALFDDPPRTFMLANNAANVAYTLRQVEDHAGAERIWRMLDAHFDAEPSFVYDAHRSRDAVLAAHALGLREKALQRLQAAIAEGFRGERLFEYTIDKTPFPAGEAARNDPLIAPLLAQLRERNRTDLARLHAHLAAQGLPAVPQWTETRAPESSDGPAGLR